MKKQQNDIGGYYSLLHAAEDIEPALLQVPDGQGVHESSPFAAVPSPL